MRSRCVAYAGMRERSSPCGDFRHGSGSWRGGEVRRDRHGTGVLQGDARGVCRSSRLDRDKVGTSGVIGTVTAAASGCSSNTSEDGDAMECGDEVSGDDGSGGKCSKGRVGV